MFLCVSGRGRGKRIRALLLFIYTFIAVIHYVMLPLVLAVIKIMALKGIWSGLVAVLMAVAVGLKALLTEHHDFPSTRFSLGYSKPFIVPEIYHGDFAPGWSRTAELHYRDLPYRDYANYGNAWDRPQAAAPDTQ